MASVATRSMRPPPWGRQAAAVLRDTRCGNVAQVDPNRVLGSSAGPADVLHHVEATGSSARRPSAPDIDSKPYLVRRRRSAGDVVIARRNVVEDYLDQIAWRAGFLMMDRGNTANDFRLLEWCQPSSSSTANVGRQPILLSIYVRSTAGARAKHISNRPSLLVGQVAIHDHRHLPFPVCPEPPSATAAQH
jgi:hypothetical protein